MAKVTDKNTVSSTRVQFDLPPCSMKRLTTLKHKIEASSYAEVIRSALRLYEAVISEKEAGSEFLIRNSTGDVSVFKIFT